MLYGRSGHIRRQEVLPSLALSPFLFQAFLNASGTVPGTPGCSNPKQSIPADYYGEARFKIPCTWNDFEERLITNPANTVVKTKRIQTFPRKLAA